MNKPRFASKWYGKVRTDELRQEIQQLYQLLNNLGTTAYWADEDHIPLGTETREEDEQATQ